MSCVLLSIDAKVRKRRLVFFFHESTLFVWLFVLSHVVAAQGIDLWIRSHFSCYVLLSLLFGFSLLHSSASEPLQSWNFQAGSILSKTLLWALTIPLIAWHFPLGVNSEMMLLRTRAKSVYPTVLPHSKSTKENQRIACHGVRYCRDECESWQQHTVVYLIQLCYCCVSSSKHASLRRTCSTRCAKKVSEEVLHPPRTKLKETTTQRSFWKTCYVDLPLLMLNIEPF